MGSFFYRDGFCGLIDFLFLVGEWFIKLIAQMTFQFMKFHLRMLCEGTNLFSVHNCDFYLVTIDFDVVQVITSLLFKPTYLKPYRMHNPH